MKLVNTTYTVVTRWESQNISLSLKHTWVLIGEEATYYYINMDTVV